jgi:hypothetical protein
MDTNNENTNTIETKQEDTFTALCKELGRRVTASGTENALLCFRAYQAYLLEHPETAHGKGKGKLDRAPSFRKAAAEVSGVAPATIDALLQVGKAIAPLPEEAKAALVGSSLVNSMRVLRKLATKEHASDRTDLITTFADQDKADPQSAMLVLKSKLGLSTRPKATTDGVKARMVIQPESHWLAPGARINITVGHIVFSVEVCELEPGRVQLTTMAMTSERVQQARFLEESGPVTMDASESAPNLEEAAENAPELAA